jgi:hypothetical protein
MFVFAAKVRSSNNCAAKKPCYELGGGRLASRPIRRFFRTLERSTPWRKGINAELTLRVGGAKRLAKGGAESAPEI